MAQLQKLSIAVYLTLLFVPILVILLLFTVIHIILCYNIFHKKSWDKPVSAGWSGIIKLTFIGNFRREKIEGTKKKLYILFDYFVTSRFVRTIGLQCLSLWQSLIVTFWIAFLVKTADTCQHDIDCFDSEFNFIADCERLDGTNITIQCYKFELDFINGTGTAGGLLAIAVAVIYGQLSLQMWLKKKIIRSETQKQKRKFKIFLVLSAIVPLLVELIFLGISISMLLFSIIRNRTFSVVPKYVLAMFYLIPLIQFTTLPLCKRSGLNQYESDTKELVEEMINAPVIETDNEMENFKQRDFRTRFKRYTAF